jgi:hypothetical protein
LKTREITPEQLKAGYLRLDGSPLIEIAIATHHEYRVIAKTEHGTFVVEEPESPTEVRRHALGVRHAGESGRG